MKQVRFDPSTSVRRHHRDPGCSWLTDEDYNRIRRGIKKDVRKARAYARSEGAGDNPPPSLNEDEMTLRGIEHLQSAVALQRQIHAKDSATEAVYREQERQARAGTALDGGALARVYMAHSRQARQVALARAASDEAFALAERASDALATSAAPTNQQHLDVLQESISIDLGTRQARTPATAQVLLPRKQQQDQRPQEACTPQV